MSRIVCQFSCGAASAVAAKLILAQHPDAIILNAFIKNECDRLSSAGLERNDTALPPLPRPFVPGDEANPRDYYTAEQMRAYARAAIAAAPAAQVGQLAYWAGAPTDEAMEAAYRRLDLSAVPHAFRPSIAFEAGARWAAGQLEDQASSEQRASDAFLVGSSSTSPRRAPSEICLPNGVMFDAFGAPRTRYVRISLDGSHCVMRPSGGDSYLEDAKRCGDESAYTVTDVFLSEREFEDLPEFEGF